jgi:hypothetical protein
MTKTVSNNNSDEWWREKDDTHDVVTQWFQVEMKELRHDIWEAILAAALNINLSVGRAWLFDKSLSSA